MFSSDASCLTPTTVFTKRKTVLQLKQMYSRVFYLYPHDQLACGTLYANIWELIAVPTTWSQRRWWSFGRISLVGDASTICDLYDSSLVTISNVSKWEPSGTVGIHCRNVWNFLKHIYSLLLLVSLCYKCVSAHSCLILWKASFPSLQTPPSRGISNK